MPSLPFLGTVMLFGGNFAPRGWEFCNGQLLSIAQNDALFSLIGTTYGGDGQTTFGLPDLRGRVPIHVGSGPGQPSYVQGQLAGEENHTLTLTELPAHTHGLGSTATATALSPAANAPASGSKPTYAAAPVSASPMAAGSVGNSGGGGAHNNRQPYLALNFVIALEGIFPTQ